VRVGLGYDIHPLVEGRALVLGGVQLDHPSGLDGHSDADVLCHAITDALLGAAALGTIGEHFPPDDPQYEGISSLELLAMAANMVEEAGYVVRNVDSIVVAEAPRLQPHLAQMALNVADRLGVDHQMVGVKATSPEGLGVLGRGEGIAAQAVVLLEPLAESEI
jgi:2-C-methyl-D-erythritol 2,4-cyclodiphosphate synthase